MKQKYFWMGMLLAILLTAFPVGQPVYAAGPTITLSGPASVAPGETFELQITVSGNPGIWSMAYLISFDTNAFTYVPPTPDDKYDSTPADQRVEGDFDCQQIFMLRGKQNHGGLYGLSGNVYKMNLYSMSTTTNSTLNGLAGKITLRASENYVGTYSISLRADAGNIINVAGKRVSFAAQGMTVRIQCNHASMGAWSYSDAAQHVRRCQNQSAGCTYTETAAHTWDSGKITKAATCGAAGVKTYTCTVCQGTKTETIAATGSHSYGKYQNCDAQNHRMTCSVCSKVITAAHTWDGGKITKAATCGAAGVKTYTCTACGATKTETIPATEKHSFDAYQAAGDQHSATCKICGKRVSAAHSWNAGEITKAATCGAAGAKTYHCTVCNAAKNETIPATGNHRYDNYKKLNASSHTGTCADCGHQMTAAHVWNAGSVTKKATCSETGVKTYSCKLCGEKKTETLPTTEEHDFGACSPAGDKHRKTCQVCGKEVTEAHTWQEKAETKAPTCVEKGLIAYSCSECGAEKTEEVDATGTHDFTRWKSLGEDGHVRLCAHCDAVEEETLAHQWDDGEVTVQPNCSEEGERTFHCTDCGEERSEHLPVNGEHAYDVWQTEKMPTASEAGLRVRCCLLCGARDEDVLQPLTLCTENSQLETDQNLLADWDAKKRAKASSEQKLLAAWRFPAMSGELIFDDPAAAAVMGEVVLDVDALLKAGNYTQAELWVLDSSGNCEVLTGAIAEGKLRFTADQKHVYLLYASSAEGGIFTEQRMILIGMVGAAVLAAGICVAVNSFAKKAAVRRRNK